MGQPVDAMRFVTARMGTFINPQPFANRRASAQSKKKGVNAVTWPHERPDHDALARAGFFFRPTDDSTDNVQCFLCTVKLDGWEETDDPVREHVAHSEGCAWATAISVRREEDDASLEREMRDPLSDEMLRARTTTFKVGEGWPHENKKGWKCKTTKLVEAGWAWDPSADGEEGDGVTCFYCNLSLDGWEPKDDPFIEHQRRAPDCEFFRLLEHYHGAAVANGKGSKTKGRGKAGARTSAASKTGRISIQSSVSEVVSVVGSLVDTLVDGSLAGADDSILTTATGASQLVSKGQNKNSRTKDPVTKTKSKKAQDDAELEVDLQRPSHDLDATNTAQLEEISEPATRVARKGGRTSKESDLSIIEVSKNEHASSTKTGGRKPKRQVESHSGLATEPQTPDRAAVEEQRLSEVSAQLQDELEHSVDCGVPLDESTPVVEPPKRGVKRTSGGARKDAETVETDPSVAVETQPAAKRPRGRPKKNSSASNNSDLTAESDEVSAASRTKATSSQISEHAYPAAQPKKTKGRATKSKRTASTRSSRSSKATVTAMDSALHTDTVMQDAPDDPERDELEIEEELQRIASEQASQRAMQAEQDLGEEFEASPNQGRAGKSSTDTTQPDDKEQRGVALVSARDFASTSRTSAERAGTTPSPNGSDKENQPSSQLEHSKQQQQQQQQQQHSPLRGFSQTRTVRVPLAASTPKRTPGKQTLISPSKKISHLHSTVPWLAVDLDLALLRSPRQSPGKLGQQLCEAAGELASPEKKMTVEEWVRHRAAQSEEELRTRCEELIASFEREGMRALESLNAVHVVG